MSAQIQGLSAPSAGKFRTSAGDLSLRFATPGYFLNMNRRFLVLCFVYYARAVQGGIPMTANMNRDGSVCLRGAISLSG